MSEAIPDNRAHRHYVIVRADKGQVTIIKADGASFSQGVHKLQEDGRVVAMIPDREIRCVIRLDAWRDGVSWGWEGSDT